jgi:Bifunctional DNA primase/polymerase, N-terminal/SNF2-related domain
MGGIIVGREAAAARATGEDTVTALHEAIGVISSVCDYAQSDDAQGFNAADAWLGHVLAQMPTALWTDDAALAAWDMLRKYRGQLAAAGIGYDDLPRPIGADELEAERREQARQRAREHAQHWREQRYRQARTYLRCDADGGQVTLAFPYDPDLVAACRAIPGRRYDGAAKANAFPFTCLPAVIELADAHQIEVTAEVRALAGIAAERAEVHATRPPVRLDGTIIIDAPFNPELNQALKDANNGRSTWDRNARVHRLTPRAATALPELAQRFGLEISDQAREVITAETARQDQNRADASAFEADPVPVPGLADGTALKAQQYPVVRFALAQGRVLIGDDMGWGKTLSSLAAVAADGAYPAVVVCRPSLTLNWAAEISRFFPALAVHQAAGTTPASVPPGTDVIIIGSAALAAKPQKTPDGGKEFGWVESLAAAAPKALIIDEGQDVKERGANRSQACEQLAATVTARDGLVLDLTGTAILNRPRELCQQLAILGRIGEFGGPKAFLWRYCLSETNEWGASYNGARNLLELHDRLRAWGIMIRRSDDAALGLPPCREHVLRIPQADLDPAVLDRYRQAEADLLCYLAEQARQTARQLGEDPDSAAVQAVMRASAAEHLVAIGALRQLAGQAKRGYVTAWVREHVIAGEKVMVAAHHRDEVDAYAAEFGGLKLQGGQSVEQKEAAKSAFQQQPAAVAPVISVAIGAGGVGHTLTAARIGIQAEQAWTPGETQQMKKRLHRIGQDRPVDYYITVAEGTIDEHLWQVVTAKQATLDAVLDGRSDHGAGDDEASVAAELTWRLTQQGLSEAQAVSTQAAPPRRTTRDRDRHQGQRRENHSDDDTGHHPGTCAVCGTAMTIIQPGQSVHPLCEEDPDGAKAAAARLVYGPRDEATIRHWRQAHVDPERVRAWCRDTGRAEPPARGALPADLVNDYLAERGAADIPMPGGLSRADWLTRRPALRETSTVQLGWRNGPTEPLTVVYGPCPRRGGPTSAPPGQPLPPCLDCASRASGDGGNGDDDQAQAEGGISGPRLREYAHRYLEEGLWPVPAWGTQPGGECCCPRGTDCPRPGKHPRSVHAGPGPRDYSWKPLACRSHAEVDQRFGPGSRYAAGNLMVALPPEMMAIDRDDDDGGRAALAELAGKLGDLPPTLAHRTPHGEHLIYRTPPGWEGRAWVGKDPANPVPAGVDLRMPGQILMAAPSVVPGRADPARYGPVCPDRVASLPAAYLTAWTPPQPAPRPPSQPMPVPPDGGDRAARYVHDALTDIAAELASHPPGGRNAAAYTAGLKAGSLLGAARTTPGAEQAAAAWTDEAAEQALIDAAQRNGYVDKDGESEARRAIRSGFRNGLRSPRALPDFAATRPAPAAQPRPPATASQHDSPRMRANRAAVAANQAYRTGDLDAARQLIDQAAALDPARTDLWQQHQEQITARRLILDAQAAHADGDHQRARHLLGQGRELDPRMPAIWDGDLPGLPPARTARQPREYAAEPGPDDPASSSPATQESGARQQARAVATPADREAPQPSWPESPSRGQAAVPAPRAAPKIGRDQPSTRRDTTAAPREPETRAGTTEGDLGHGTGSADDDPSTRWPAPNPHAAKVASPPDRQSVHLVAATMAARPPEQAGGAADAEAGDKAASERPAVAPGDWRDRVLADARQPWQPGPAPRDAAADALPERQACAPAIEPDT